MNSKIMSEQAHFNRKQLLNDFANFCNCKNSLVSKYENLDHTIYIEIFEFFPNHIQFIKVPNIILRHTIDGICRYVKIVSNQYFLPTLNNLPNKQSTFQGIK